MRKNRLLLCFLLGIAIVFYGIPYLPFQGSMIEVTFSGLWLVFALFAISGNLIALLYGKKISRNKKMSKPIQKQKNQKIRQYS